MIRFLFFLLSFLLSSSDVIFVTDIVLIDSSILFFLCITPFIFYSCFNSTFLHNLLSSRLSSKLILLCIVICVNLFFMLDNMLLIFISLEISTFFTFYLLLSSSKDQDKISSSFFILFTNIFGSVLVLAYCFLFTDLSLSGFSLSLTRGSSFSTSLFLLLSILFLTKIPVFGLHFWLGKAHVRAFGTLSMILASLLLKFGGVGVMKICYKFHSCCLLVFPFSLSLFLLGTIVTYSLMFRFCDLKFIIALSSVVHMRMIFPFRALGCSLGNLVNTIIISTHGFISLVLFFLVTKIYERTESRSKEISFFHDGLNPFFSMFFLFFVLLNLGVPPFTRFIRELFMIPILMGHSRVGLVLIWFILLLSLVVIFILVTKTANSTNKFRIQKSSSTSKLSIELSFFTGPFFLLFFFYSFSLILNVALWRRRF